MSLQVQNSIEAACSPFSCDLIVQGSMALVEGASLTVLPREAHGIVAPVQPQGGVHGEVVRGGDPRWSDPPPEGQGAKGQGLCHGEVHSAGFILAHLPETAISVLLQVRLCNARMHETIFMLTSVVLTIFALVATSHCTAQDKTHE